MDASVDTVQAVSNRTEALGEVRELYLLHANGIAATLKRLTWPGCDVDDLLQEVFIVALRRPQAVLFAQSPKAWLFGVATRVASGARRKRRIRNLFGLGSVQSPMDARLESADVIQHALTKLSTRKRDVLVLFELQGLTGPEIAQAVGCPLKTVWTRLHHARKELEAEVRRHG
jgi:RNA polymerase sigma-70 factor (ECF subfamily)